MSELGYLKDHEIFERLFDWKYSPSVCISMRQIKIVQRHNAKVYAGLTVDPPTRKLRIPIKEKRKLVGKWFWLLLRKHGCYSRGSILSDTELDKLAKDDGPPPSRSLYRFPTYKSAERFYNDNRRQSSCKKVVA